MEQQTPIEETVPVTIAGARWDATDVAERVKALKAYIQNSGRFKKIARFVDAHGRRLCQEPMPGKKIMSGWIEDHATALVIERPLEPAKALVNSAVDVFHFYHMKVKRAHMRELFTGFVEGNPRR